MTKFEGLVALVPPTRPGQKEIDALVLPPMYAVEVDESMDRELQMVAFGLAKAPAQANEDQGSGQG